MKAIIIENKVKHAIVLHKWKLQGTLASTTIRTRKHTYEFNVPVEDVLQTLLTYNSSRIDLIDLRGTLKGK